MLQPPLMEYLKEPGQKGCPGQDKKRYKEGI